MSDQLALEVGQAPASKVVLSRGQDAFTRAQSHSRRVQALKYWLPGLAALAIASLVAWSYFAIPQVDGVAAEGAAVVDGKLIMANPKMDGFTADNLPYSVTAVRATQDIGASGTILLEDISATLPVSAENTARIVAKRGVFDNDKNTLAIDTPLELKTTDGMIAKLQSADVKMGDGSLSTTDPVEITMKGTRIEADSLTVSDNGAVMVFEHRVRVDIDGGFVNKSNTNSGEANAGQ